MEKGRGRGGQTGSGSAGQGYDLASFSDATQIGTSYCLWMVTVGSLHITSNKL